MLKPRRKKVKGERRKKEKIVCRWQMADGRKR
jgi:hypothetical protein